MELDLEQRLLRMLAREEAGEAKTFQDLHAMPVAARVLEGECIAAARFIGPVAGDNYAFEVAENQSKFRRGDAVAVGDGLHADAGLPMAFVDYDEDRARLLLGRDPFSRGVRYEFVEGQEYCVDRRPLGLRNRLVGVVRAGFADARIQAVLRGEHQVQVDAERLDRARESLAELALNPSQREAGAAAIATDDLALIQGPPGTGKTRLLAEVLRLLCNKGCRIAVTAFTHKAVDNALLALRRLDAKLPLIKLGKRDNPELDKAGIRFGDPRRGGFPAQGCVVAGTSFALAKLPADQRFHFTVFDEAGQMPIPHAMAGMLLAQRWVLFGDHRQLPPVITGHHADREAVRSVFEHLHGHYGSHMLDLSYRMNGQICGLIGECFYDGRLQSADPDRRMPFRAGGNFDEVLDPERSMVLCRVDHLQPGARSKEEARLVADLCAELRQRHEVPAAEIAVLAPFRAQVRAIRSALQKIDVPGQEEIVVDTVERMQGQEREVILVSMAVGDPATLNHRAAFFFSTNRINVALSRARSKAILVASKGAFEGLPMDPEDLRAASLFRDLYQRLPQVDLSAVYA